jgi:hypothetical protein
MESSRRVFLIAITATIALLASSLLAVGRLDGPKTWSLTLTRFPPAEGEASRLWLGLTNRSSSVRLLCVAGWGYTFDASSGVSVSEEQGSPHSCGDQADYRLVPAGMSTYWPVLVSPRVFAAQSAPLNFDVNLVEISIVGGRRTDASASWRGSMEDALRAGRRLLALR